MIWDHEWYCPHPRPAGFGWEALAVCPPQGIWQGIPVIQTSLALGQPNRGNFAVKFYVAGFAAR